MNTIHIVQVNSVTGVDIRVRRPSTSCECPNEQVSRLGAKRCWQQHRQQTNIVVCSNASSYSTVNGTELPTVQIAQILPYEASRAELNAPCIATRKNVPLALRTGNLHQLGADFEIIWLIDYENLSTVRLEGWVSSPASARRRAFVHARQSVERRRA